MSRLAQLRSWIRSALGRADLERRMRIEMEAHLDLYEADLRRRGVAGEEARRRTRAEFGSVAARKDDCREAFGLRLLDELRGDVSYALRLLRRSPAFTAVALLSLGLGIGANTAIFSLVDTVLLKSLPVADPQRLFFIDNTGGRSGGSNAPPYPCFEVLRDGNRFFSGMAAFDDGPFNISIDGSPLERVFGQTVSGNYFDVLGVRAVHGRVLTPADDAIFDRGGPDGAVAVISYGLWKRRFALDPAVIGKSIKVGTRWVTIVGVTEPEFFGLQVGSPMDITMPMMLAGSNVRSRTTWWMSVVGRLKPDASVEQARADIEALWDRYMTELGQPPGKRGGFTGIVLVPALKGLNELRRSFSEPLLIMMTIVGVVLLIGCANVANLLLARASARRNEMAVRLAIGAGRGRLVRQLLTEGAVLVALGSALGLLFARWGVSFITNLFNQSGYGRNVNPEFDLRVLAFTAAVAALTALLFSLAPALHATRMEAPKPVATTTSPAGSRARLGQSLVVIQVMLSVILICGAALFLKTLHNLNTVDTGFDREGVLTTVVQATVPGREVPPKTPEERRRDHTRLGAIWESLSARLTAMPGVTSAAVSTMSPLTGHDRGVAIAVEGGLRPGVQDGGTHLNHVTAGYFDTIGIRVVSGRALTPQDRAASRRVVVLNETAARAFFGAESPIGRRVNFPKQRIEDHYEIVGVVRDARYRTLREPDERMVYIPLDQAIDPITMAAVAVRGPVEVMNLAPALRTAVSATIPGSFVTRVGTIEERVNESLIRERMLSMLATFFGGLALTLASIGLYGVMAYTVVQRTREIGIHIAIGARQRSVIWMVVRATVVLVAVGSALGSVTAVAVSRFVKSQLFGVTPGDPIAIFAAVLLLLVVAAVASYLPARRASRIDPVRALRCE